MAVVGFTFAYTTPTQDVDAQGNPITVQVPSTFTLGGISLDVAKGILLGLNRVPSITNVTAQRLTQTTDAVTQTTT